MTIFQIVPFYLDDDKTVGQYFKEHRKEIDAITAASLIVIDHPVIAEGNAKKIVEAMRSGRFKDVTVDALPCLYVEGGGGSFVHRLPNDVEGVKRTLRLIAGMAVTANSAAALKEALVTDSEQPGAVKAVPTWFPIAGYIALAVSLIFLMAIYVYSVTVRPVQQDVGTRMILVFVISLALAMGLSFIGGDAVAKGKLPIFENALNVSVAGGVGVWVIAMVLGYQLFAKDPAPVAATQTSAPAIQIGSGARIENANISGDASQDHAQASAPAGR